MHNLEHGYTVVWYRASAPQDQITVLQQILKTFSSDDYDAAEKFIAAPWTDTDPAGFPDGKNVVLTRWTADPNQLGQRRTPEGRPPGLFGGERSGDQGLHGEVPVGERAGAQRRLTPWLSAPTPSTTPTVAGRTLTAARDADVGTGQEFGHRALPAVRRQPQVAEEGRRSEGHLGRHQEVGAGVDEDAEPAVPQRA